MKYKEIVIRIPEKDYDNMCRGKLIDTICVAIRDGIVLPKRHGRLIDADSLIKAIEEKAKRLSNADTINGLCGAVALIFEALTIVEAESKEENNESNL